MRRGLRARQPAGTSQQTKISAQIAAALPECGRMEIQSVLTDQRTQVDVHRSTETIPTREPLFLLTLNVPERVADVLEVEPHTAFEQAGPLATPSSKEMTLGALACLVAVRATKSFSESSLSVSVNHKETESGPD